MSGNKPITVQASLVLLILRLAAALFIVGFFFFTIDSGLDGQGFLFDTKRFIYEKLNLRGEDHAYLFGFIIGKFLVPGVSMLVTITGILRKKYYLSIIFLSLDFLFMMSNAIPMVPIIVLVLMFLPPTRRYFSLDDRKGKGNDGVVDAE